MTVLSVNAVADFDALRAHEAAWSALAAGVPFRSPAWLGTWWRRYGDLRHSFCTRPRLCVVTVEEAGRLVGLAPWYVESSPAAGRVIRFVGSGEVCSDYLGIVAEPQREAEVAEALADFLCRGELRWDRIETDYTAVDDGAMTALQRALADRRATVFARAGLHCWRMPLPSDFDEYLAALSKSHRKQVRQLCRRVLDSGRAVWRTASTSAEFEEAWATFVDLHQRRRRSLGERGCFRSPRFAVFHYEVARKLLAQGMLRLHTLELDGCPLAAEYHLAGGGTVYGYQAGVDPTRLDEEPGRLAGIAVVRQAIADGFRTYDLLRGDEPYKAHWRAMPTPMHQWTIVNPRISSRVRYAARRTYRWLRGRLRRPMQTVEPPVPAWPRQVAPPAADGANPSDRPNPSDMPNPGDRSLPAVDIGPSSTDVRLGPVAVNESPEAAIRVFVP
jgi:CelD/BcsL family acetyltransferase involved in cellulose biosynthesis